MPKRQGQKKTLTSKETVKHMKAQSISVASKQSLPSQGTGPSF